MNGDDPIKHTFSIVRIKKQVGTAMIPCYEVEITGFATMEEAQKRMQFWHERENFTVCPCIEVGAQKQTA